MPWINLVQIPPRVRVAATGWCRVAHSPDLALMDPELHNIMDHDVIVFNENDILEVRGMIQGAILNGNKVRYGVVEGPCFGR